jgi:DNA-binding transcriptional LysR family regulator
LEWLLRLRLQHLKLFVDLAESGSLTQTARIAHTTQPGLSKWLKDLEESAGVALFQRHARGLRLTEYGELMLNHAERVLREVKRAQHGLESLRDGHSINLTIGASPAATSTLLPMALLTFMQRYPHARVEVAEDTMSVLIGKLMKDKFDLVIGRFDNHTRVSVLKYEVLYNEPIAIVARVLHPLCRKRRLQWQDLYSYDWIAWPVGSPIRDQLDRMLARNGLDYPPIKLESASHWTNVCLLQSSDMLSVVSQRVAERLMSLGLAQALLLPMDARSTVGVCWRGEPVSGSSISLFLDVLRACAERSEACIQSGPNKLN